MSLFVNLKLRHFGKQTCLLKSSSPPAAGGMVGCGPGLFTVASRCLISNSGHRANGFEFEDTQAASIWEKSVSAFLEPEKKRTGSLATLGDRGRV